MTELENNPNEREKANENSSSAGDDTNVLYPFVTLNGSLLGR